MPGYDMCDNNPVQGIVFGFPSKVAHCAVHYIAALQIQTHINRKIMMARNVLIWAESASHSQHHCIATVNTQNLSSSFQRKYIYSSLK